MPRLDAFLQLGREQGCSDIHFAVAAPPMLRLHGDLTPVKYRDLGEEELRTLLYEILTDDQKHLFEGGSDVDFSYSCEDASRFRINLFRKNGGIGATARVIASNIPSLEKLGLPAVLKKLTHEHQGMLLVTGATGTGKSTTLAAMIDHINTTRKFNIITLEDPIEYVHTSKMSLVIQREVGVHVESFADGLRAALREDPDVILVGEMRDAETISMAMKAAETGHLVFGTLHTTSATKTLDRILDALPAEQKPQALAFLSQGLKGVISQSLVRSADGRGRKAMLEIMLMTPAISNLLMTGKVFQIPSAIQTGRELGMQLMDQALLDAVQRKEVDPDHAYMFATDKKLLQRFVTDPKLLPQVSLVGR